MTDPIKLAEEIETGSMPERWMIAAALRLAESCDLIEENYGDIRCPGCLAGTYVLPLVHKDGCTFLAFRDAKGAT